MSAEHGYMVQLVATALTVSCMMHLCSLASNGLPLAETWLPSAYLPQHFATLKCSALLVSSSLSCFYVRQHHGMTNVGIDNDEW